MSHPFPTAETLPTDVVENVDQESQTLISETSKRIAGMASHPSVDVEKLVRFAMTTAYRC